MNNRRNTWIKATLIIRNVTRFWNSLIFRPELPPIFVVFCCRYVTPVHIPRPQINYTCVRYEWDLCQCCLQKKVYVTCRKKSEVWISWSFWLEIIKILTNSNSRKILRDSMDDTRFLQCFTPRLSRLIRVNSPSAGFEPTIWRPNLPAHSTNQSWHFTWFSTRLNWVNKITFSKAIRPENFQQRPWPMVDRQLQ